MVNQRRNQVIEVIEANYLINLETEISRRLRCYPGIVGFSNLVVDQIMQ